MPVWLVLFPTAPRRTGHDRFRSPRLSSDYCVMGIAVGFRWWMVSWQVVQTTRVLRRFLAMSAAHSGFGVPGLPRWASLPTWWTCTWPVCWHFSHRPAWRLRISSLRRGAISGSGWRSVMIAVRCRLSGMPPNVAVNGFRPGRVIVACTHMRGPYGVGTVAVYRAAICDTVESYLQARVFSSEVTMTHRTLLSRQTSPARR